jgi:hypothetical protein
MLPCQWCNGPTRVLDTRLGPQGHRRRLQCQSCGQLTRSIETYESGRRMPGPLPGVKRRRSARQGASNGRSVLTDADIRRLREQAAAGTPRAVLAKRYGVTPNHVTRIVRRRAWRHVA